MSSKNTNSENVTRLSKSQMKAYLARLDLDVNPPTKEFLFELHRAHVEKIPWQSIDVFAGKPTPIDFEASVHHILSGGSGYCFHLNGAFSRLLQSLGFNVILHRAGVQPRGDEPRINSFHLGLSVLMPDANQTNQRWIVDVGLGDMPYEPLPALPGEYKQGPFIYKVGPSTVADHGWHLENDPLAPYAGVDYDPDAVEDLAEFEPKHAYLSTSPESNWVNLVLVRHRHKEGSHELRGCVFSSRNVDCIEKSEITGRTMWFELLGDVFGEKLNRFSMLEKDELWAKVVRKHEEWKNSDSGK